MHSRIFQVSTEPIDKENYLNEDTLQQGDGSFYDYDTLCYNGGIEQWKEEYVANVKKKAEALTVDNMLEWSSTYYLKQAVEYNRESDTLDVGQAANAGIIVQHRFPYDHNVGLDANLQAVNEKLNELEEYRTELQEVEYSGGMQR